MVEVADNQPFKCERQCTPAQAFQMQGLETPQERLKRLMAAQISKQQAKDTVSVKQRQQAEARDAAARRQIERAAMSIERRRSPSPSPRCHLT